MTSSQSSPCDRFLSLVNHCSGVMLKSHLFLSILMLFAVCYRPLQKSSLYETPWRWNTNDTDPSVFVVPDTQTVNTHTLPRFSLYKASHGETPICFYFLLYFYHVIYSKLTQSALQIRKLKVWSVWIIRKRWMTIHNYIISTTDCSRWRLLFNNNALYMIQVLMIIFAVRQCWIFCTGLSTGMVCSPRHQNIKLWNLYLFLLSTSIGSCCFGVVQGSILYAHQ